MNRSMLAVGSSFTLATAHQLAQLGGQLGVVDWIMVAGQIATVILAILDQLKKRK